MAGPGGGPPRKSHTKSRKGCKTCKKRHIRCDETFPQCRNCTKHNCKCDYLDQPPPVEETGSSPSSELLSDAQVVDQLKTWRTTGHAPFPELGPPSQGYWQRFPIIDQRLLHHIALLSQEMHEKGYSKFTIWASKMPIFLTLARSNDFVMSALLALSASHLAWLTGNSQTQHLSFQHRGVALGGLHEAIGTFSPGNSEAILAASILLSWQATEWRDWASLQQGVSTILNAMNPWLEETELGSFLQLQRASQGSRTPVIPSLPQSNIRSQDQDLAQLDSAISHIFQVQQRVSRDDELAGRLAELVEFIQELKDDYPVQAPEQAFERLQKLRMWLFWLPPALLLQDDSDIGSIAVLAQFFSASLMVEPLFPEIGGSYFGSMAADPLEEMRTSLLSRQAANPHDGALQAAVHLTEFPYRTLMAYKTHQQYLARRPSGPHDHTSLTPSMTLRPSYFGNEPMSPYQLDTLHSPPAGLVVPVPSPYLQPGLLSRPASYTSRTGHVSPSPTYTPGSSRHYSVGTPTSTPDPYDLPHHTDQLYPSSLDGPQNVHYATSMSPCELWI